MNPPDKNEVHGLLSEFHPRIRAVVERSWQEWVEYEPKGRLMFLPRFRAVFIFDAIARNAVVEFAGDTKIRVKVEKQTVKFLFKDQVFTRFKKGNSKGVGSNIETQAVLDFIDPQRSIPGLLPEVMRVEFCYGIDELGLNLNEVAVVARNKTDRIWAYQIPSSQPAADILPFPPAPGDLSPPTVFPRKPEAAEEPQKKE
jgi:hypothetical protein